MKQLVAFFLLVCILISNAFAERKVFTFSADATTAILAEGKEYTVLRGNAIVTADDVRIEAGEIKLYGDDFQFAEVIGNFSAIDLKNDFSLEGGKLFYDRTEKLLRAEGNIVMKDNQNDLVVRAHFLESKNDGDFMVVQLGVRITKKDELSARTEFLTYYRKTEILEMTGFPYALWKEDEYSADRVSINLDNDEVHLEGQVRGFISTQSEEEENGETNEENTGTAEETTSGDEGQISEGAVESVAQEDQDSNQGTTDNQAESETEESPKENTSQEPTSDGAPSTGTAKETSN